jgi:hypothetical protein
VGVFCSVAERHCHRRSGRRADPSGEGGKL